MCPNDDPGEDPARFEKAARKAHDLLEKLMTTYRQMQALSLELFSARQREDKAEIQRLEREYAALAAEVDRIIADIQQHNRESGLLNTSASEPA
ncbi:MAG: hypothetical protein IH866_06240 [Chloroflexi bacterium]|nr:hypothetical protein [Chloroflexota bacterium]